MADHYRAAGYVAEVLAYVPPLTPVEVEHYQWLIGGLVEGALMLSASETCPPTVAAALGGALELFDELMARIPVAAPASLDGEVARWR